ncbi:MAG: patatin-like phospholipase family protein [Ardenticatenaceae bacterium]|nr:patatin-like phospholipase family protein [Anaerolineales bacterium]MCB8920556.1 patatin-like phospholipase family protein [Ardenticatenaceae bacterium]MCB8990179.1 patatin-like phospholipase family protein [Ardenticatenaceae bacterium]MCB9003030.1 patatin-like phospholipase family protein [Ardenticatenaceae bacterium]
MTKTYPFKNLAFQGGGVKTLAYQGALNVLEEQHIFDQIERVAGTSAGATVAMLLSFRLSAAETIDIFNTLDFSRVPAVRSAKDLNWQPPKLVEPQIDRLVSNLDGVKRLLYRYGWYASDRGYDWLHEVIAQYCKGNGRATFADFRACDFRDLHVVVTNISSQRTEIFNADNTPNVAVADALLISQSIPLFFEAVQFDGYNIGTGDYYGDGGVLNNFPIHIFDRPQFAEDNEWFVNGVNWQTLGVRLFTPLDCPGTQRPITNLASYMANLFGAMVDQQDALFDTSQSDRWRTINISNCCVSLTDFSVRPGSDDPKYQKLVAAGEEAATHFLANYEAPTPDQLVKLKRIISHLWPLAREQ